MGNVAELLVDGGLGVEENIYGVGAILQNMAFCLCLQFLVPEMKNFKRASDDEFSRRDLSEGVIVDSRDLSTFNLRKPFDVVGITVARQYSEISSVVR